MAQLRQAEQMNQTQIVLGRDLRAGDVVRSCRNDNIYRVERTPIGNLMLRIGEKPPSNGIEYEYLIDREIKQTTFVLIKRRQLKPWHVL